MPVGHYENFPVASLLLPAPLRHPVSVIYRFARSADDFADEGDLAPPERLARLEAYRAELRRLEAGQSPSSPLFRELAEVIGMDPVGRLMLHLYGEAKDDNVARSDAICSALQLTNFWQDVEIDFRQNRIYLPQDDMARFGVSEAQIGARDASGGWWSLMRFQIERARNMMLSGAPLAVRLPGRIGLEIRSVVQGGLRILEKLERSRGDVFRHRPVLRALDWPLLLARALVMR